MYEKTLSRKTVYEGHIIDVDVLDVELENGKKVDSGDRKARRGCGDHSTAVRWPVCLYPPVPQGNGTHLFRGRGRKCRS